MLATKQIRKIGELTGIKRIVGSKWNGRKSVQTRNLVASEIAEVGNIDVQRDTECNWFSKSGGGGWDTLLVVLD